MPTPDSLVLSDGRRLDIRISGPEGGLPLVFHHGTPGAAPAPKALERAAHARGLRLVTLSRPGYGDSARFAGRQVVDVVADTAAVLESIGADRCLVAGWSGGGPHALACAARLPGAAAALIMAGVAPFDAANLDFLGGMGEENIVEFGAALEGEATLRTYLDGERPGLLQATVDDVLASLATVLPEVDKLVLTEEFGEEMAAGFGEALRVGIDGWLDDDLAFTRAWGFDLAEIDIPVMIWQGSDDLMVPFAHGEWFAANLPTATTHLEHGEGHLSIVIGALDRMLDELIAAA